MATKTKISKKQAAITWQDYLRSIRNATPVDLNESVAAKHKRKTRLEAPGNHEEWFKYYFPKYAYAEATGFHKDASNRVVNNPEWYEVRMWSRELAKSTRTFMEVMYLCFVKGKRFVVLTSATETSAEKLLRPYKGTLEANERLIADYGQQEKVGSWEKLDFTTRTGICFIGVGLGNNPRGAKNEEVRPDILLFDDVDTDKSCRNPEMVKQNWEWLDEAVMGLRSVSIDTTVIWCGNRIAVDCCVFRASKFADKASIVNIRDEKGRSTWPSKNSEERIDRILSKRSYAAIQKEYFNNPIVEGSVFKAMAWKLAKPIHQYSILVCYTDPSYKDTGDFKATVLVGKWQDEFHVIKAFVEQTGTAPMISWHYQIMDIVGDKSCYFLMEEVFLQDTIIKEFYAVAVSKGRTVPIQGDKRKKDDKFTRIEALLSPLHNNGKLYLNERERQNPHMARLAEQFVAFAVGSRAHDDGPDAVEGAVWVINTKTAPTNTAIYTFQRVANPKRF